MRYFKNTFINPLANNLTHLGGDSLVPLVSAAYAGDTSINQPAMRDTPDARYLVFVEPLAAENGRLLGVEIAIIRTPTPATVLLLVLAVTVGGLTIFSLAAALIGTLFGWRTARKLSGRLAHLSQVSAAWGQGNLERQIEDDEADEFGELGENLNRVAAELQTLLADREKIAYWKNGTAWRESCTIRWRKGWPVRCCNWKRLNIT